MAQKRMLNKSISLSKQVNKLSLKHKLFYTWAIPHQDDYGLLDSDPEILKATICPMVKDISEKDIIEFITVAQIPDMNGETLIREYQDCIEFTGFEKHQTISAEKRAKPKFQKIPKIPQENSGENNNPQESPEFTLNKGREEKLREEKGREENSENNGNVNPPTTPSNDLEKRFTLSEEEIQQFEKEFSLVDVRFEYAKAKDHLLANGGMRGKGENKPIKDYKAYLRNWFRKDWVKKKPIIPVYKAVEQTHEVSQEGLNHLQEVKKKLNFNFPK
ncbi:MAG: dnaD/phage-associated protein [uncultured bacterium]|nr:MAG: dnaD/phage-associated protein [uncultured bacterium]